MFGAALTAAPKTFVDKISLRAIFHLSKPLKLCSYHSAMVAHTDPVRSWGPRPCGEMASPTTTCVSAGGGVAPRPPGTGRGKPEVQTLRNSVLRQAYGRRPFFAGVAERRKTNEQQPSHEAASSAAGPLAMALRNEGAGSDRAGGGFSEEDFSRVIDDLGTAAQ